MDNDTAPGEFNAKFVQCRLAIAVHSLAKPIVMARKLAAADMTLAAWRKRTRLSLQC
ncbi:hypothetical protein [Ochrobactrum soli]|uniref:hypothetical protein n=1 Tax=Ochrobactrum soli TaxID=2448455 RepID=UPI001F307A88|nr:hypothetical protein [[Ochrobactrum] soli]